MTLTVLTDEQIRTLLEALTASELEGFSDALASALHEYATGANDQASAHQPERISVQRKTTGATTLFMPSCSSAGNAVKGIYPPPNPHPSPHNPHPRPPFFFVFL
jgi:hypothetical protein